MIYKNNILITTEKCKLFENFSNSLIEIIDSTYLGDEFLDIYNQFEHFEWCWEENIRKFTKNGVEFSNSVDNHDYYLEFIYDFYYESEKKDDDLILLLKSLFSVLFDYSKLDNSNNLHRLLPIYNNLNKSLKTVKIP